MSKEMKKSVKTGEIDRYDCALWDISCACHVGVRKHWILYGNQMFFAFIVHACFGTFPTSVT